MKKLFFAVILSTLFVTTGSFAQEKTKVIKTNPLGLAFGNFNVTYETVISESSSLLFDASYMYKLFGVEVNTFGVGAAYRYYFTHASKELPTGFYVNPQAGISFGSTEGDVGFTAFSVGAEVGYQWSWDSGFTLDLGIGPNYTTISGDVEEVDFDSTSGILPSATLAVGYAF